MAESEGLTVATQQLDPSEDMRPRIGENHAHAPYAASDGSGKGEIETTNCKELILEQPFQATQPQVDVVVDTGTTGQQLSQQRAGDESYKAVQDQEQGESVSNTSAASSAGLQAAHRVNGATTPRNGIIVALQRISTARRKAVYQDNASGLGGSRTDDTNGEEAPVQAVDVEARRHRALTLARYSVMPVDEVPKGTVRAAKVMAGNAMMMAAAEIVIEILVVAGVFPKLPFRLDFFFLTILSGLLGFHVVRGLMKDHFDTSMNALQVSALVEIALIAGDIKFMVQENTKYSAAVPTRAAFAVLTSINLMLVAYLAVRLVKHHRRVKKSHQGVVRN